MDEAILASADVDKGAKVLHLGDLALKLIAGIDIQLIVIALACLHGEGQLVAVVAEHTHAHDITDANNIRSLLDEVILDHDDDT